MEKQAPRENPMTMWWLGIHMFIFFLGGTFSLWKLLHSSGFRDENLFFFLIFIALFAFFYLIKLRFYLSFLPDALVVNGFLDGQKSIPYGDIIKVFIRQTPSQRFLGRCGLLIQFKNPKGVERITIRAFGHSIQIQNWNNPLPGIWGDLVVVPEMKPDDAEKIKDRIIQRVPNVAVEYLGTGYPRYSKFSTALYIINSLVIAFLLLTLVGAALLFLIIR